jgi:hypothetical protein
MAGSSRALTLKLLADINDFTKNINKADNEVSTFGDKITKFGKMAGKLRFLPPEPPPEPMRLKSVLTELKPLSRTKKRR